MLSSAPQMETDLFRTVQENNEYVFYNIRKLISRGADVNRTDNKGKTALFYAVQQRFTYAVLKKNNERVVRALIDAGADVNITDNEGKTALFYAVQQSDNQSVVHALIAAGADVNITYNEGKTALFYAVQQSDNESVVYTLIDAGADVNRTDNEGKTALFYAVQQSNNQSVVHALIDAGADVNITYNEGKTALFYAVQQSDNQSVVRALIAAGVDVNRTDNLGNTALFYAVQQRYNESVVRALIAAGTDVNINDNEGKTVFFYPVQDDNESVVRAFIDAGVNIVFIIETFYLFVFAKPKIKEFLKSSTLCNKVDRKTILEAIVSVAFCKFLCFKPDSSDIDVNSLSAALRLGNEFTSKLEIKKRIMIKKMLKLINEVDIRIIESRNKSKKLIQGLIELGANPNTVDSDGNTALHYATQLALRGVSQDTVMEICHQLEECKVSFDVKNHRNETPLLFCLSRTVQKIFQLNNTWPGIKTQADVCRFLVKNEANVEAKTKSGDSVLHLAIKLLQHGFLKNNDELRKDSIDVAKELLELFLWAFKKQGISVSIQDSRGNTPLHLWATLQLAPGYNYSSIIAKGSTLKTLLKSILRHFREKNAQLNVRNQNGETPLHLCRTWAAVELLLDAGANPNVVDSLGRSPLLAAANNESVKRLGSLYLDISQHPREFWKSVLNRGLKPWTVDEYGESVLSLLMKLESLDLVTALVQVACDQDSNVRNNVSIMFSLLISICKDTLANAHWKKDLAEMILSSTKCPVNGNENEDSPLHYCCRNIKQASKHLSTDVMKTTVYWSLGKLLRSYGADCAIRDARGLTCLDIANKFPALQLNEILGEPVDLARIPRIVKKWKSVSEKHKRRLAIVARDLECKKIQSYWYHRDHLATGSFGFVFAGIHEKDGREVAIKRIEKIRMQRPEDKREITSLASLADCEHVVRYICFFEAEDFSYIVLELMEGNLDEFLDNPKLTYNNVTLCQHVVKGLQFLHERNIIHRDLKPKNILFKTHPKLCLKIADFGLSRYIDSTESTITVYGNNVGTRCWIAPEVLNSTKQHSKSSDVFACGLVLHYILSVKKHPFAPKTGALQHNTEENMLNGHMEGWDDSLCPEATHLLKEMLDSDYSKRATAAKASDYPFLWTNKKKVDLLRAVGNQPEFQHERSGKLTVLTEIESDLESKFTDIVKYGEWNDPGYVHMPAIYAEMTIRRSYDIKSVVELLRFVRNAYAHAPEKTAPIPKLLLEDFVFLEYFPNLVMEVYKTVIITHGWDQTREEIQYAMKE